MMKFFNASCTESKNDLAVYSPGDYFEDNEEYTDIRIQNQSGTADTVSVKTTELKNFLKTIASLPSKIDNGEVALTCYCDNNTCKQSLVYRHHSEKSASFFINNSKIYKTDEEGLIILNLDQLKEWSEKF